MHIGQMWKRMILAIAALIVLCSEAACAEDICTVSSEKEYMFESDMAVTIAYRFLTEEMGLNRAAASGVIANFISESGIRTTALGDSGTSYGLCQWHAERWDKLRQFAASCKRPMEDIETQLRYFKEEMNKDYPEVYRSLLEIENTEAGAYKAGYIVCLEFERPFLGEAAAVNRGSAGISTFTLEFEKYTYSDATLKILYMLAIYQNSYVSPEIRVGGSVVSPIATDTLLPDYFEPLMTYDRNYWSTFGSESEIWPEWIQTENIDSYDPKGPSFFDTFTESPRSGEGETADRKSDP